MATRAMQKARSLSEQISSLNELMEELAAAGEWQDVSGHLATRNALLLQLEERKRFEALQAAQQSNDRIRAIAHQAHETLARKLTGLTRGKKATDSYRTHA